MLSMVALNGTWDDMDGMDPNYKAPPVAVSVEVRVQHPPDTRKWKAHVKKRIYNCHSHR